MAYQYPIESNLLQWEPASTSSPLYANDHFDPTWAVPIDSMQDPCVDLDYWREVSWDQLESELESPMTYTSGTQSPTAMTFSPIASYSVSYASSSLSHASLRTSQNINTNSEHEIVDNSRVKRRRLQNRNSQRAYRERTRQKEEQMTAEIAKLQGEINELRKQERGSTEMIEALTKEIERLKMMGPVLHYHPQHA